jgi:hypothetical protein
LPVGKNQGTAELFWWIGDGDTPRYPDKNVGSRRNDNRLQSGEERREIMLRYQVPVWD